MARWAIVVLVAGVAVGCAGPGGRLKLNLSERCQDGRPPRMLVDAACPPDGICGFSCLPGRWDER